MSSNGKANGETESNLVVCPNSADHMHPLAVGYELHYASREEIAAHGGVCEKCFNKFKRHNGAALKGVGETPVEMPHVHHELNAEQDHAGYVAPGEAEQITDFPFHEIDEALGLIESEPANVRADAAALFRQLMAWCWAGKKVSIRLASVRFAVLTAGVLPDLISDFTYSDIGAQAGVTKQAISKVAKQFEGAFKFKFARSRSPESAEHMRESMTASHARRRGMKGNDEN